MTWLNSEIDKIKDDNSTYQKMCDVLRKTIKTYKLTFKQFFLMLLDDDIFIDIIEMTFVEEKQKADIKENLNWLIRNKVQVYFHDENIPMFDSMFQLKAMAM